MVRRLADDTGIRIDAAFAATAEDAPNTRFNNLAHSTADACQDSLVPHDRDQLGLRPRPLLAPQQRHAAA
jgi:hypothetical protein